MWYNLIFNLTLAYYSLPHRYPIAYFKTNYILRNHPNAPPNLNNGYQK